MKLPTFKPFSHCISLCAASMLLTNAPSFAQTFEKIEPNGSHWDKISTIALTSDGKRLMSLGESEIIMRDAKTGKIINGFRIVPAEGKRPSTFILPAIQPGTLNVACTLNFARGILITNMDTLQRQGLKGQKEFLDELLFSPDGKMLFTRTRSADGSPREVKVWDMATMKELKDLSSVSILNGYVSRVHFVDGSKELLVATNGKPNDQVNVCSLDTKTWKVKKQYPTLLAPDKNLRGKEYLGFYPDVFSPDGKILLANQNMGDTFAFDTKTGRQTGHLPVKFFVWSYSPTFQFTPNGKRLLILGSLTDNATKASHQLAVLDTTNWKVVRYIDIPVYVDRKLNTALLSPDGGTVYYRSEKNILRFDVATGKQLSSW